MEQCVYGQRGAHIGGDLRGTRLECDSGSATHTAGTAIDLTVVSPLLAVDMQWEVLPSPLTSDHFPILITTSRSKSNEYNLQDGYNHHKGR